MKFSELQSQLDSLCAQEQDIIKRKEEVQHAMSEHKQLTLDRYNSLLAQLEECKQDLEEMGIVLSDHLNSDTLPVKEDTALTTVSSEHEVEKSDDEIIKDEQPEHKYPKGHLLTPYFYVWGIRHMNHSNCSTKPWEQDSPRLLTPFNKLTSGPINKVLNMGNQLYRETFKTPDEGRIYSSNGIAPTLTATHSDLRICIGKDPRTKECSVA